MFLGTDGIMPLPSLLHYIIYVYALFLLCMRLYFIMYMSLRFVLMLFLFMLYVLQCPAVPSLSCPHVCCGMAVLTQRGVLCNQIICKNQHPVY